MDITTVLQKRSEATKDLIRLMEDLQKVFDNAYADAAITENKLDADQVDDMMTAEEKKEYDETHSACCDAGITNGGHCHACGEHT